MAVLKDLIVQGKSKFLNDSYFSKIKAGTWEGSTVGLAFGGTGVTTLPALKQLLGLTDASNNDIYAKLKSWNNLLHSGNEFTFASPAYSGVIWINYRTSSGSTDGAITQYIFGNGAGTALASITSGQFSGNAATATSATTASKLSNITSTDTASSSADWRKIWMCYADGVTGRPAVTANLAFQTSTNTLKSKRFLAEHTAGENGLEYRVTYSTTVDMAMMIGSGNANHGLYDNKASKWMIYADASGNVTVNGDITGNAATATSATSATTATTADKLSTVSKTAWGQTYWTDGGVPASISGDMTSVGNITATRFRLGTNSVPNRSILLLNSAANKPADIIFRSGTYTDNTYGDWAISSRGNETANSKGNSFCIFRGAYNGTTQTEAVALKIDPTANKIIVGQSIFNIDPEQQFDVNGVQQIYQRGNDNTAFKNLLLLKQQNSTEHSGDAWVDTDPSFGIGFRRYWTSSGNAYGETTHAGIYSTISSNWRGGLVFRTKNNQTQEGTHDVTALKLMPSGGAVFANRVEVANSTDNANHAYAGLCIRELNYGGASPNTWGVAPRLAWNWNGFSAAQIALASNGHLYISENNFTNYYRIVMETGTWAISISGAAAKVKTTTSSSNAKYYMTFVDSDNSSATDETVYTSSKIHFNPSTGRMGIDVASPEVALDVNGDIQTTGDARIKGNDLYIGTASGSQCHQTYDTARKCLRFSFD